MFYKLAVRPVLFMLPPEFTHELSLKCLIWWHRWFILRCYMRDIDYWIVVIVAFTLGMMTPVRWRRKAIIFWINVAIALRAGLPKI